MRRAFCATNSRNVNVSVSSFVLTGFRPIWFKREVHEAVSLMTSAFLQHVKEVVSHCLAWNTTSNSAFAPFPLIAPQDFKAFVLGYNNVTVSGNISCSINVPSISVSFVYRVFLSEY